MLSSIIKFDKMRTYYPLQINGSRFQMYLVTPKKIQIFQDWDVDSTVINFFVVLIKHVEIKMISDMNKFREIELYQMKLKEFMKKYKVKTATMTENDLPKVSHFPS